MTTSADLNAPEFEQAQVSTLWSDISDTAKNLKLAWYLAKNEIVVRYKRTFLGPFWTTLSLAIFIGFMSLIFAKLWHTQLKDFVPYFASGYIAWMFFSYMITEGCKTYTSFGNLIKDVPFPYTLFAFAGTLRNMMVFFHHAIVFVVVMLIFHVPVNAHTLLFIPGFLLLSLFGFSASLLLGVWCARFRDIEQVVINLLQVSMFVTPIFWPAKALLHMHRAKLLVNGNPLYHFVEVVRLPLIGVAPSALNWLVVVAVTAATLCLALFVFHKCQHKLVFWV